MSIRVIGGSNTEALPLSEAVRAGDYIFVSGILGFGHDDKIVPGGVSEETDRIMLTLTDVLSKAESSLSDIVKIGVFLANAEDFDAFNKTYIKYFPQNPPARICVVTDLTIDARVELDCTAYVGN